MSFRKGDRVIINVPVGAHWTYRKLPREGVVAMVPHYGNDHVAILFDGKNTPRYVAKTWVSAVPAELPLVERMRLLAQAVAGGNEKTFQSAWVLLLSATFEFGIDLDRIHAATGIPMESLWKFNANFRESGVWWFDDVNNHEWLGEGLVAEVAFTCDAMVGAGILSRNFEPPYVPRLPSPETTVFGRPIVRETRPRFDGCETLPINPNVIIRGAAPSASERERVLVTA